MAFFGLPHAAEPTPARPRGRLPGRVPAFSAGGTLRPLLEGQNKDFVFKQRQYDPLSAT